MSPETVRFVFKSVSVNVLSFQINMTLRASLQKLKQNIAQLKEGLLRASSSRRMYLFEKSGGGHETIAAVEWLILLRKFSDKVK